jgi:polyphosphate kinase 2 (PPK2 family)
MFGETSTLSAPWTVVEANYKWYARLKVLKATIKAIEGLDLK